MLFDQLHLVYQVLFFLHKQSVCTRVCKCVHVLPQARRLSYAVEAPQSFPTASLHLHTTNKQVNRIHVCVMCVNAYIMCVYVCVLCACVHLDFQGLRS